ncbi:MAG: LysR family transcriptional regulator [Gammaproteobacteria bacterium]|nr:LysR family transcriptional regulator [Gammaproteobacteria bacterium]
MKNATFRQLQLFESIVRSGSYTGAAEELHLTQPTVSMQIKKLSGLVGAPLFEQLGKRVFLTDAGKELLEASREIFGAMSRFEMRMADMKGIKQGNLNLTGVTTAEYFAPRILGAFCQIYPGIKVSLTVTNRERVLRRLTANEDDLYIVGQPPADMDLVMTPFLENPLVVLAPPDHPLVGVKKIPLEVFAEERFIMREPGCGTHIALDRILSKRNLAFKSCMELGSNEAIKQAVAGKLGVSTLSAYALSHELQTGELAILDVEGFPLEYHWYIAYPRGKQLSVVAQTFFDYLMSEGKKLTQRHLPRLDQPA